MGTEIIRPIFSDTANKTACEHTDNQEMGGIYGRYDKGGNVTLNATDGS